LNGRGTLPRLQTEQLLAVAEVAERSGDDLRAQQYLLAALKTGTASAAPERVLPRLLQLYIRDGQYRLATETLRDHLRRHPQQHGLRLLLADLYAATQLSAAAVTEYERVLSAAPASPRAHFALGSLLHDVGGEPARADLHLRAYLAYAPEGVHAEEARALLERGAP
jgi:tetratricopeptide (TPR) repeat protein